MKRSSFNELTCLAFFPCSNRANVYDDSRRVSLSSNFVTPCKASVFLARADTQYVFQVYARHSSYRILTKRRISLISSGKSNCPSLRRSCELEYSVPSRRSCLNALHACTLGLPAFLCLNTTVATQGRRCHHHIGQLIILEWMCSSSLAGVCLPPPGCSLAPQGKIHPLHEQPSRLHHQQSPLPEQSKTP